LFAQLEVKVSDNLAATAQLRTELSNQRSRAAAYAAAVGIAVVVVTTIMLVIKFATGG
jgi:hypothetical protein